VSGLPVLSDIARTSYRAAGMRRSLFGLLHPRLLRNLLRALRRGFRQRGVQGDAWQQGGVLVVARDGRLLHAQLDGTGGDELDLAAVLAAWRAA